jgi:hypothetical protein
MVATKYIDGTFRGDVEVHIVLDQHTEFYWASLLKQQSVERHVAPLRHIILIESQAVLVATKYIDKIWHRKQMDICFVF